MSLHEPVRLVARQPGLDEREQEALAEVEAVAELEVARASAPCARPVPRRARRSGRACSRARGTHPGSSRARPTSARCRARARAPRSRGPTTALARTTRASPQIRSATTGFRLCGIADEPFWPWPNGSCTSAHLGSRQVPDLEREPLERRRGQRQRRQQLRMPVALHDLRRGRLGLEPEPLARDALDLGIDRRVVPDRAGELPDPDARKRGREPRHGRARARTPTRRA